MTVTDLPITIISTGPRVESTPVRSSRRRRVVARERRPARVEAPSPAVRERVRALHPALRDAIVGAALLIPTLIVSGAWIDTSPTSWYGMIAKPPWLDSTAQLLGLGIVLSPVGLAVAGWAVGRQQIARRGALGARLAVAAQGILLLAWVWLMFVAHHPQRALAGAVLLVISSTLTIAALWRIMRFAAVLAVPALALALAAIAVSGGLAFLG